MPLFKSKKKEQTTVSNPQHFLTPEKILLAQCPVFGGEKNESFNKFYNHIQMQMTDETESAKIEFMFYRLHGAAADAFIQLMTQNNSINFDDITHQLKARFPEPHSIALQVLRRRKQLPHETLETFASSIKDLVNKFFTNSRGYNKQARDFQTIKFFLYNVGSPLKQQLKKFQRTFHDLNDVLLKAIQLQQINQNCQVPQITQQMSNLQLQQQPTHQAQSTNPEQQHMQLKPQTPQQSCYQQHRQYDPYSSTQQPQQRQRQHYWQGRQ